MIKYIFNIDIKKDIQKNILKYQKDLSKKASRAIHQKDFDNWLETKEWLDPSLEVMLNFNNLYFNFQLNKLIFSSEKIMSKDFKNMQKAWIDDYAEKFWTLNKKYNNKEMLTQKEFENFFEINQKM
jgi:hypothetical protein